MTAYIVKMEVSIVIEADDIESAKEKAEEAITDTGCNVYWDIYDVRNNEDM